MAGIGEGPVMTLVIVAVMLWAWDLVKFMQERTKRERIARVIKRLHAEDEKHETKWCLTADWGK